MTQEEKAKAYDKALVRASKLRVQNPFDTVSQMMEYVFPELAESEDERVRKALIDYLDDANKADENPLQSYGIHTDKAIAWLEKLGYKQQGKTALETIMEEKSPVETLGISPEEYEEMVNECIYSESVDKVEPKFHAGDWIISNNKKSTYQVVEVKRGIYVIRDNIDNHEYHIGIEECEKSGRPWTIKDAKDGDLIYVSTEEKGIQAIFHEYKNRTIFFHCYLCGDFIQDGYMPIGSVELVHPLQKVHCRRFFEKMREACYEWDAEKKELKKIEQKLANSTKTCKNDTLLGLLQKMPSCITVDGIDYHFVMKKTSIYIAYYACYKGNGEEGLCHGIFGITAHSPIDLLTEMLEILKEKGLL